MTSLISLLEIESEEIILKSLKILSIILTYYNIHNMNITKEQIEILEDLSMSTNPKVSYETNEFINFKTYEYEKDFICGCSCISNHKLLTK